MDANQVTDLMNRAVDQLNAITTYIDEDLHDPRGDPLKEQVFRAVSDLESGLYQLSHSGWRADVAQACLEQTFNDVQKCKSTINHAFRPEEQPFQILMQKCWAVEDTLRMATVALG